MKKLLQCICFCFAVLPAVFGVSQDEFEALEFAGLYDYDKDALYELARIYEKGDGVISDELVALSYYLAAAKLNHREALTWITKHNYTGYLPENMQPRRSRVVPPKVDVPVETTPEPETLEKYTANLGGGVTMELMKIPSGTFMMGSPSDEEGRYSDENQVRVRITKPFYLGKTEVTQAQWEAIMGNNPSYFKGDNLPVEKVSWDDAVKYCEKLTERECRQGRLASGWKFTLPTEAQWEYACRAGTTTRFSFGNSNSELYRYGNFYDRSGDTKYDAAFREKNGWKIPPDTSQDDGFVETAPVGSFRPNAWGLYDMHGNVWEWCLDYYNPSLSGGDNPVRTTPGSGDYGSLRVNRGGSWFSDPRRCRSALRNDGSPGSRGSGLGFRVAIVQE